MDDTMLTELEWEIVRLLRRLDLRGRMMVYHWLRGFCGEE